MIDKFPGQDIADEGILSYFHRIVNDIGEIIVNLFSEIS